MASIANCVKHYQRVECRNAAWSKVIMTKCCDSSCDGNSSNQIAMYCGNPSNEIAENKRPLWENPCLSPEFFLHQDLAFICLFLNNETIEIGSGNDVNGKRFGPLGHRFMGPPLVSETSGVSRLPNSAKLETYRYNVEYNRALMRHTTNPQQHVSNWL